MKIDPLILGYIFEKYLNIEQKSTGAYYTRDEITDYLNRVSIHSRILTKINKILGTSYKSLPVVLSALDVNLCKILLTDKGSVLNTLSILDPAVGCGAFLISAMKTLLDIYCPIIVKVKELSSDEFLDAWYKNFTKEHKNITYGIKRQILLKNLYGSDINSRAIEVCRLRLFLSLTESAEIQGEPRSLPNIDFNIMSGNSLIGLLKKDSLSEQYGSLGESFEERTLKYNEKLNRYKNEDLTFEQSKKLKQELNEILKENKDILDQCLADDCNATGVNFNDNAKK